MYTPRAMGGVSGRIPEFLENLKVEFESLAHDANMYKMQRDDYERKLTAQLNELNNIQQTLFELERKHTTIKTQYEEEIIRLRRQLEMQNSSGGNPPTFSQGTPSVPPIGASPIVTPAQPAAAATPAREHTRPPVQEKPIPRPQPSATPPVATTPRATGRASKDDKHDEDSGKKSSGRGSQPYSDSSDKKGERNEAADANGADWIVGYNPVVQTNLNIDLSHNLEHQSVVCCVKFSHDGKHLATGCNKSAQIYDAETGEKVHTFTDESGKEGDLYIRSVCFSPDNRFLAAGAEDKTVKIWDIEQKRMRSTFIGHELDIYSLDFSYDGKSIVSGSGDKKAKIWDVEKGECLFTLGNEEVGPKDGVTSVAFSPDGKLVAAGSLDKIVRLWDARTGYFLERYEGHLDSVYSVAFSPEPDSKSLASGSLDKTLKLWDLAGSRSRSRCRSTFSGHKDYVLSVAFSHDGNWLISGSKDRTVQFWDPRSAVTHMMLQGHKNSVISVAVSPTGGQFATGSGDFRARVWKYD